MDALEVEQRAITERHHQRIRLRPRERKYDDDDDDIYCDEMEALEQKRQRLAMIAQGLQERPVAVAQRPADAGMV